MTTSDVRATHLTSHPIEGATSEMQVAERAGLPVRGQVQGTITLIQESRFRLEDAQGRGYLFVLGKAAGASMRELFAWSGRRIPVIVVFEGPPDLGATAVRIRASPPRIEE